MEPRVAYLTGEYLRISPFVFIYREIKALRKAGLEVGTFSIRGLRPGDEIGPDQKEEQARTRILLPLSLVNLLTTHLSLLFKNPFRYLKVLCSALQMKQPGLKGLFLQAAYFLEAGVLAKILRQNGYTHLHNHFGSSSSTVACLASLFGKFTFSFTIHGTSIRTEPQRWRIDLKARHAQFVICISEYCKRKVAELVSPSHQAKLQTVHCGIDPVEYSTAQPHRDGTRLLFIGRLVGAKGVDLLLDAMAKLRETHADALLTIVGTGPDQGHFHKKTNDLNLGSTVEFTGHQDPEQIKAILNRTDILVLPSFAEGVPIVLMEAMASGIPVVSTNIAGIPELVDNGKNGFLVPPGELAPLVSALTELLDSSEKRIEMGQAGQLKVRESFDIFKESSRLKELFEKHATGPVKSVKQYIIQLVKKALLNSPDVEILKQQSNRLLTRIKLDHGSVVLKLWEKRGVIQLGRALTRTISPYREWRALKQLHPLDINTPVPYGYLRLGKWAHPYTHALVMEDLGICQISMLVVKDMAKNNQDSALRQLEDKVIELTLIMLKAGVLDPDHGLANILITPDRRVVRMDLEIAVSGCKYHKSPRLTGKMIGRLIASHAYAVQPLTSLTDDFGNRLIGSLPFNKDTLAYANEEINYRLKVLRDGADVNVQLHLPLP